MSDSEPQIPNTHSASPPTAASFPIPNIIIVGGPPKPEGYVAKDAVYQALMEWEENGGDADSMPNSAIFAHIKAHYNGYEEKTSTISSYKSQYKKSLNYRPGGAEMVITPEMFKLGLKLAPILQNLMEAEEISKEKLKAVINLTLDTIEEE